MTKEELKALREKYAAENGESLKALNDALARITPVQDAIDRFTRTIMSAIEIGTIKRVALPTVTDLENTLTGKKTIDGRAFYSFNLGEVSSTTLALNKRNPNVVAFAKSLGNKVVDIPNTEQESVSAYLKKVSEQLNAHVLSDGNVYVVCELVLNDTIRTSDGNSTPIKTRVWRWAEESDLAKIVKK